MKPGDLVRLNTRGLLPNGAPRTLGFVMRVDKEYFGSNTAYKISKVERGKCIRSDMVDIIAKTADGIRDRVLVLWNDEWGWEYRESTELEVISESG